MARPWSFVGIITSCPCYFEMKCLNDASWPWAVEVTPAGVKTWHYPMVPN